MRALDRADRKRIELLLGDRRLDRLYMESDRLSQGLRRHEIDRSMDNYHTYVVFTSKLAKAVDAHTREGPHQGVDVAGHAIDLLSFCRIGYRAQPAKPDRLAATFVTLTRPHSEVLAGWRPWFFPQGFSTLKSRRCSVFSGHQQLILSCRRCRPVPPPIAALLRRFIVCRAFRHLAAIWNTEAESTKLFFVVVSGSPYPICHLRRFSAEAEQRLRRSGQGTFTNMCRSAGMAHLLLLTCLAYLNAEAPPPSSSCMACFTVASGNSSAASPGCLSKMGQERGGGHGAALSVCLSKSGQEGGGGDDGADWSSDEAERSATCLTDEWAPPMADMLEATKRMCSLLRLIIFFHDLHLAAFAFLYSGFAAGSYNLSLDCVTTLTNFTEMQKGNAFYPTPLRLRGSVVGIVPVTPCMGGHSLTLVVSPTKDISSGFASTSLGLHNDIRIFAVKLDTVLMSPEFHDLDNNHVGVDVNTLDSTAAASVGYYDDSSNSSYANPLLVTLITKKLNKTNHVLWKAHVLTAIHGARLQGHIVGKTDAPASKIDEKIGSNCKMVVAPSTTSVAVGEQLHQLQAAMPIAAAAAYSVDTNCYTDTGATDHVTSELEKLSVRDSTRKVTTPAWQAVQPPAAALTSSLPDHVRLSPVATTSSIGVRGSMMAGHLQRRLDFLWLHRHTVYQLPAYAQHRYLGRKTRQQPKPASTARQFFFRCKNQGSNPGRWAHNDLPPPWSYRSPVGGGEVVVADDLVEDGEVDAGTVPQRSGRSSHGRCASAPPRLSRGSSSGAPPPPPPPCAPWMGFRSGGVGVSSALPFRQSRFVEYSRPRLGQAQLAFPSIPAGSSHQSMSSRHSGFGARAKLVDQRSDEHVARALGFEPTTSSLHVRRMMRLLVEHRSKEEGYEDLRGSKRIFKGQMPPHFRRRAL
ncbi:hypothetical protein HU200_064314 [Digitaria exilis]|uniref:Legume lectin domain-containing protein n=1 Tax=Digitaria exilis TaxID=1010633 RepID=A0A835DYU4_9POAL|nr:hypothetical protein HU200_064314 [Digitaria exilis]